MRGRRGIAIFVGVAGLLLLVVIALLALLQGAPTTPTPAPLPPVIEGTPDFEEEPNGPPPVATIDPQAVMVEVVVSLQTVPRGWQMTPAELTTDIRLASEVGSNVITRIEDAIGLYARRDIYQGETLTADTLARDPTLIGIENYGPSSIIPEGWVAMAIPMDRLSSVAYGLEAGDNVDIMFTLLFSAIDEEFQTLLQNSATFILEVPVETAEGETVTTQSIFIIDPFGRFEQLPTNDVAHIFPSEDQRPIPVSYILQNARVINVGMWTPPEPPQPPTPTPDVAQPTPDVPPVPTPVPPPPNVLLVALQPQQQLFLKYALESFADIDFALRSANDTQLYASQPVDLNYFLQQFNIDLPPNFNYTLDPRVTPQPTPQEEEAPGGGGVAPGDS